tara:strand:- start:2137 stop:4413 length:2277 start_codon:yes stop_codon:yes gene_type:complete
MALQKLNAQILEGGLALDNNGNMTLTGNLYATDVGDDDDPIEDFYVSNDSIWIGDEHKLQVSSTGKMKFRKRKVTTVPAVILAAGGDEAGAKTHSGKSSLSQLKKKHWRLYARSLGGSLANAKNKDIFRDNKVDYSEESDASAWQVNDVGETYATVNVGIGNTNPASSLHITGTDSLVLPAGTVAQRGTATQGGFRFNTETPGFEGYDGTEWGAIGGGSASELSTATTLKLKGSYAETMLFSDAFTLEGDLILTDNLFLAKLGDDGNDITLSDDGTSRTITGQGTLVPGAMFDNTFAISTAVQPNITQIGTTASIKVPTGTTAQRGTALTGAFRYNTTTPGFEGYDGTEWGTIGGGGLKDTDEDTYITAEATADVDALDFWTAGTQRMTINSSGNVGIGTTAPSTALEIAAPSGIDSLKVTNIANYWSRIVGSSTTGQSNGLIVDSGTNSSDTSLLVRSQDGNSTYFKVRGDGNVGIGTATPGSLLHIEASEPRMRFKATRSEDPREWEIRANYMGSTPGMSLAFHDVTASADRMTITNDGHVGIGTILPDHKLQIKRSGSDNQYLRLETDGTHGTKPKIQFDSGLSGTNYAQKASIIGGYDSVQGGGGGYIALQTKNTSETVTIAMYLDSSQHMYVTGDVTSSASDERLKENIEIIENAVDKIKAINGIKFNWKLSVDALGFSRNNKTEVGVIAQQVNKVLPEAVSIAPFDTDEHGKSKSGKNYLTVKYERMVPLLIEAIKEQQQQIDELKEKLNGI